MTTVDLEEVKFDKLAQCCTISILGKRRTGKTTWATHIAQYIHSRVFVVMCGNKDNMTEWQQLVAPLYVRSKCTNYLQNLRDFQDERCSRFSNKQMEIPSSHRVTLIFDDCGYDRKFMHSEIMKDLLSNGRHYGMYIIILCQYLNQMHAVNRDQLDYIGILYTANVSNMKKLYNEFMNVCDFRTFKAIVQGVTSNRGMCWIDNTTTTNTVEETVFFAQLQLPIQKCPLGDPSTWEFSSRRYLNEEKLQLLGTGNKQGAKNCTSFQTDEEEEEGGGQKERVKVPFENITVPDKQGPITIRKMKFKKD